MKSLNRNRAVARENLRLLPVERAYAVESLAVGKVLNNKKRNLCVSLAARGPSQISSFSLHLGESRDERNENVFISSFVYLRYGTFPHQISAEQCPAAIRAVVVECNARIAAWGQYFEQCLH